MNNKRKSNCLKVLEYLKNNRYITVKSARSKINVDYCTQRVYDLKTIMGVKIHSYLVTTRNNEKYAIYTLSNK